MGRPTTNETVAGRDQLQRAEYLLLDDQWRPLPWAPEAPLSAVVACRSGLTPASFEAWLDETAKLDREARSHDSYAIASIILADLDAAVSMARQIE